MRYGMFWMWVAMVVTLSGCGGAAPKPRLQEAKDGLAAAKQRKTEKEQEFLAAAQGEQAAKQGAREAFLDEAQQRLAVAAELQEGAVGLTEEACTFDPEGCAKVKAEAEQRVREAEAARVAAARVSAPQVVVRIPGPGFGRGDFVGRNLDLAKAPPEWKIFYHNGEPANRSLALRLALDGPEVAVVVPAMVPKGGACFRLLPGEAPERVECPPSLPALPPVETLAPTTDAGDYPE